MIDLHCHILPGVDDGAKTIEESLAMLTLAAEEGIKTIIATPHHLAGGYDNKKQRVDHAVKELNNEALVAGLSIKILSGQEIRLHSEILNDFTQGDLTPLSGSGLYYLVEFPFSMYPSSSYNTLLGVMGEGYKPILAHPERYRYFKENPSLLFDLIDAGVLMQVTAGSLTGAFGKSAQALSFRLLDERAVHFIASDAHDPERRDFKLAPAYDLIEKKYGPAYVNYLKENTYRVLNNDEIFSYSGEFRQVKRKGLFGRLKK